MQNSVQEKVHQVVGTSLILSNDDLKNVMVKFEREIKKGLKKDTQKDSEVKCFVTFVQDLPTGKERGKFLALDLGGTNFRVLLIHLKGEEDYEFLSKIYEIPNELIVSRGRDLFDHIAHCLSEFVKEQNIEKEVLALGFTFSFPVQQEGLNVGNLIKWTKGFNCSDCVGKNVVELLEDAIRRRSDIKILVCAILNDTTGTLMSSAWTERDCKIGVIIGTGSNACYLEKATNAEFFEKPGKTDEEHVIINTEFGAFGENGSLETIRTDIDREIDAHSINPKNQLFEKMISGFYLGEMVRLVLLKLIKAKVLFNGQLSARFQMRNEFYTKFLSEIEAESVEGTFEATKSILLEMGIESPSIDDCKIVRYCCELISCRAAKLVSAALATLILRIGDPKITIGVDGSVYRFHPNFKAMMTKTIGELIPSNYKFKFVLSQDGSGRGAALVAAVASKAITDKS